MSAPQDKGCRDGDSEKAFSSLSQNRRGGLRPPLSFQSYPWLFESPRSLHTKNTRSDSTFSKPFSIVTAHEQPRLHA